MVFPLQYDFQTLLRWTVPYVDLCWQLPEVVRVTSIKQSNRKRLRFMGDNYKHVAPSFCAFIMPKLVMHCCLHVREELEGTAVENLRNPEGGVVDFICLDKNLKILTNHYNHQYLYQPQPRLAAGQDLGQFNMSHQSQCILSYHITQPFTVICL